MSSGGGTTKSTVTQSSLPAYAQPYYESMMDRATSVSQTPYQPYQGQRLAGESGATQQGLSQMQNYAQSGTPMLNQAENLAGQVGQGAMGFAGYQSNAVNAQNVGTQGWNTDAMNQYMSPYETGVIQSSQANAVRNAQMEQQARNLQAAQSGSFGGSRAAVQNQMAANALQVNLSDIYSTGMQNAYQSAQSMFTSDQARQLQAAQSNQSANLKAQEDTEQFRQGAADIGLKGLGLASTQAGQMAQMQGQQDQETLQRAQAQLGVGQTQENYQQQQLDQSYQDFVNQRDSEKQNLQFLSSMLQGVPVSANSDVTQTNSQNNLQGALGTMGGLQTLYSLGKQTQ